MQCESKICTGRDNKNKRKARKSKQQQQNGTGNKYQFKRMPEEANKPLVKQSADIPPFASACCQQTKPTNRKTKHGRFWRTKFCFVFFPPFYSVLVPTWNDYVVLPTVMNRFITKTSSCKKEKEGTTSVTNYHPDVVPPPHHFKTLHTNQAAHYYLWKKNTSKLILSQSSQTYFSLFLHPFMKR